MIGFIVESDEFFVRSDEIYFFLSGKRTVMGPYC